MPFINVEGPKRSTEVKRKLVERLSQAMAEVYEMPVEAIVVHIEELGPENVGLGGKLLLDNKMVVRATL